MQSFIIHHAMQWDVTGWCIQHMRRHVGECGKQRDRLLYIINRRYALARLSTVPTHWWGYCREILTLVCHQYLTYFTTFYLIINNILTILHIKDNMKTTEGTATGRHDMRVTNSLNPQTHYLCSNTFLYATTNNDN